jgi:hypothetical protein
MSVVNSHQEKSLHDCLDKVVGWSIFLQLQGDKEVAKPYIQGKPGGGKTASIIDMCKRYNWNFMHLHLPLIPIEDISGLPQFEPIIVNGETVQGTRWTYPEILSEIYKLSGDKVTDPKTGKETEKPCIVFLDDMHLASSAHLAMGFELFSEKKLRTYKIPKNVAFVLAGNATTKAGTKTQNSAITNRLALYPVKTSFNNWRDNYAYKNDINSKIMAFLSRENYQQHFHEEEVVNKAWGSPRSWTYLSNLLTAMEGGEGGEVNQVDLSYITNAHVSGTAAAEFVSFYHIYSKTEMDKIFDGTKKIVCPDEELDKYIYGIAAGQEYVNRSKKKDLDATKKLKLVEKVSDIICAIADKNSEIAISAVKSILDIEKALSGKETGGKTSYVEIARMLKIKKSKISAKVSSDLRKIAGAV